MADGSNITFSRRDLLALIGTLAGSTAMYHAMTSLGFASDSAYQGPIKLSGDAKGASVLILGAGLAGMTAALELRNAGYKVQVLEFNARAGGRNWTLRGGDSFVELGGYEQTCEFAEGLYLNPGPWRIPYHHRALLDYCKRLNVALEPFVQLNYNTLLHASGAFGGQPQRLRTIKADFQGEVAELLAKVTAQGKLDEAISTEDKEILLQALKSWGALDNNYAYKASLISADVRGYAKAPGGGIGAEPVAGETIGLSEIALVAIFTRLPSSGGAELAGAELATIGTTAAKPATVATKTFFMRCVLICLTTHAFFSYPKRDPLQGKWQVIC